MKKVTMLLLFIIVIFIIDRYAWMPNRVKGLWLWEDGLELGDPISYNHSFVVIGSNVVFKEYEQKESWPNIDNNRKGEFYLLGCYFGKIYFLEKTTKEISTYIKK